MPRPKKRRGPVPTIDEDQATRTIHTGAHIHVHEIHGPEMVRHLRRRYRVALGYRPDA